MMLELELRRLELADLDAIEQIERASYRTPWSRSMFSSRLMAGPAASTVPFASPTSIAPP